MQTGILPIDAMIPIGRGQRVDHGDRSAGKTTICIVPDQQARLMSQEAAAIKTFARSIVSMSRLVKSNPALPA
jgi:F0F1-type ATP synthase alpha subunit